MGGLDTNVELAVERVDAQTDKWGVLGKCALGGRAANDGVFDVSEMRNTDDRHLARGNVRPSLPLFPNGAYLPCLSPLPPSNPQQTALTTSLQVPSTAPARSSRKMPTIRTTNLA